MTTTTRRRGDGCNAATMSQVFIPWVLRKSSQFAGVVALRETGEIGIDALAVPSGRSSFTCGPGCLIAIRL